MAEQEKKSEGRVLVGTVVSDKMSKTRTVRVDRITKHPKYGKVIRKSSKFSYHDEKEESLKGDTVEIVETRPISKSKTWRLVKIVEKAKSSSAS